MNIQHYFFDGIEYSTLHDPFGGVSPMTPERFVEMGGTIGPAQTLTPQETFLVGLDEYLDELQQVCAVAGIHVTKAEFKSEARKKLSGGLVAWAKSKGVPDPMIAEVRDRVLVLIADASRLGLSWDAMFAD